MKSNLQAVNLRQSFFIGLGLIVIGVLFLAAALHFYNHNSLPTTQVELGLYTNGISLCVVGILLSFWSIHTKIRKATKIEKRRIEKHFLNNKN